jgi:hypothetical protein
MLTFSNRTNMFIHYNSCEPNTNIKNVLANTKFYGIGDLDIQNPQYLLMALDSGCIPIHIRQKNDDALWNWLSTTLNLVEIKTKEQGGHFMKMITSDSKKGDRYAEGIHNLWLLSKKV